MSRLNNIVIQELVKTIDLQEYMKLFLPLKRSGDHLSGKCPFHQDSTPSFHVWRDHFHCFGCGKRGDIIEYEMHRTGTVFRDAVVSLAERFGYSVETSSPQDAQQAQAYAEKKQLHCIMEDVSSYYHEYLMGECGKEAREYLASRGYLEAQCLSWKLGLAPSNSVLEPLAVEKNWKVDELEKLGLLGVTSDGSRRYDFFRGRIVIPIRNERGQAVGFGGRVFRSQDVSRKEIPKFINPRETLLYQKSKILFNFDKARAAIAKSGEVVVVEGYMDAMSLANAGVENVVSVSGTALTVEHVKLLSKVARKAMLCFDSDAAGQRAAERAFDVAYPLNLLELIYVVVSGAKDPDEYVQKFGSDAFRTILLGGKSLLERVVLTARGENGSREVWLRNVRDKIIPVLLKNPDAGQREIAMDVVASTLGLSSSALIGNLGTVARLAPTEVVVPSASDDDSGTTDEVAGLGNVASWSVLCATEIRLVVAFFCFSPSEFSNSYESLALRASHVFRECTGCGISGRESSQLLQEVLDVARASNCGIAPSEMPLSAFEGRSLLFRSLAAIVAKDKEFLSSVGLPTWPIDSVKNSPLVSADLLNVLVPSRAGFFGFTINDVMLSRKKGRLESLVKRLLDELEEKARRARLLGTKGFSV